MSGVLFVVAAGGLVALVTTQLVESRRQRALRARFRRRRRAAVDLREGDEAGVHGHVRVADGTLLEAPISGRACVAWEVLVHADARGSRLVRCAQALDFLIEESCGSVRVRAATDGPVIDGHALRLAEDLDTRYVDAGGLIGGPTAAPTLRWWSARAAAPSPPDIDTYLKRIRQLGVGAGAPPRIEERCLVPGERVSALGLVVRDDALAGVERRYREEASALVIAGASSRPLVVTNDRFYF
ncbi:MAG: hypothetical protein H6711_01000 [Myxococcales bacterium]|nr:hypothetical protein [Myxococcales bacterium]